MFENDIINGDEAATTSKKTAKTNAVQGAGLTPGTPADERLWGEWVKSLGVSRAIARGACAEVKGDWDSPVSKSVFESSVKNFSEKGHGR
jgi:hypothetical protein